MELVEQFRGLSLVCDKTPDSVKLCMLKLTNHVLDEIRVGQKSDLKLIDQLTLINQGNGGEFQFDEISMLRFRDRECILDV